MHQTTYVIKVGHTGILVWLLFITYFSGGLFLAPHALQMRSKCFVFLFVWFGFYFYVMLHSLEFRFCWSDWMPKKHLGNCQAFFLWCKHMLQLWTLQEVKESTKSSIFDGSTASLWVSVLLRENPHHKFMHIILLCITVLWTIAWPFCLSTCWIEPTYTSLENNWHNIIFNRYFNIPLKEIKAEESVIFCWINVHRILLRMSTASSVSWIYGHIALTHLHTHCWTHSHLWQVG